MTTMLLYEIAQNSEVHIEKILPFIEAYGAETVFDDGIIDLDALPGLIKRAADKLLKASDGTRLRIYRGLNVPEDWRPISIGRHWTLNREQAFPHLGDQSDYVVITGLVDASMIDAHKSVMLNMLNLDFCEDEVVTLDDAEILIVTIEDGKAGFPMFQELWGSVFRSIPTDEDDTLNSSMKM